MIIQTEEKDFARDAYTGALINTNSKALYEHKLKREQAKRLEKLEHDIDCIKSVLFDLKQAITDLGKK